LRAFQFVLGTAPAPHQSPPHSVMPPDVGDAGLR
jgi:hypothetical protein